MAQATIKLAGPFFMADLEATNNPEPTHPPRAIICNCLFLRVCFNGACILPSSMSSLLMLLISVALLVESASSSDADVVSCGDCWGRLLRLVVDSGGLNESLKFAHALRFGSLEFALDIDEAWRSFMLFSCSLIDATGEEDGILKKFGCWIIMFKLILCEEVMQLWMSSFVG